MLFNSPIFLFGFLPIFFLLYFITPNKYKNHVLIFSSIFFYAWGEPVFVFIALASAILDWFLGNIISKSEKIPLRKFALFTSIVANIGLLAYFKYANFFVDSFNRLLAVNHLHPIKIAEIALPLAISFIVFEKITYTVDIYKKIKEPANSIIPYLAYVLLFPKLIAGPIVKYHDISEQLNNRIYRHEDLYNGFIRFCVGLSKKVLIADTMGEIVDPIFKLAPGEFGLTLAWLGVICFAIQIYFDFSGYSDMAIGLMRMMGFKIPENFNMPYISSSFTEFWRRWHISLSTWIKEYLYIPLGGNRVPKYRQYINLMICFLLSGLWHGANWTFVLWGFFHGIFLTVDKMLGIKPDKSRVLPRFVNTIITFILVLFSWVIFRSENIHQALSYMHTMIDISSINKVYDSQIHIANHIIFFMIVGLILSFVSITSIYSKVRQFIKNLEVQEHVKFATAMLLLMVSIGKISTLTFASFLYFRF